MKQINVRLGKESNPSGTIEVNARRSFIVYSRKYVITDHVHRGIGVKRYTSTHYKTGAKVIDSISEENISDFIERTKTFLQEKGFLAIKRRLNELNLPIINGIR